MQNLHDILKGISSSLLHLIPEGALMIGFFVLLVAGMINNQRNILFASITLATSLTSILLIAGNHLSSVHSIANGMLIRDGGADFIMLLVDVSVALTCLLSLRNAPRRHRSEFYAFLLAVAAGCHFLVMSNNLVMVFVSLELVSITSYVLAGYAFDRHGSEGSFKYFLFGSVASAAMLYGFSLIFGITGTLDFTSPSFISAIIEHSTPLLFIAALFALAGFLFKMAAVPMQSWAPDVYQAAPIPVIAYFSVAPKVAALWILARFTVALHGYGQSGYDWQSVVAGIAVLTILAGNLSALWQKDSKRMMAYSSIAHSGFLLVGLAAFMPQGVEFMLFYAAVYLLMNYGVFALLLGFEREGVSGAMTTFSGAGPRRVWAAAGLTFGMIALAGIPPTGGFTAKLFVFTSLWQSYLESGKVLLLVLLVVGLVNTVISLFYYLRIPWYAWFRAGELPAQEKNGAFENFLGLILVLGVVVIFFLPGLLMGLMNKINFVL